MVTSISFYEAIAPIKIPHKGCHSYSYFSLLLLYSCYII